MAESVNSPQPGHMWSTFMFSPNLFIRLTKLDLGKLVVVGVVVILRIQNKILMISHNKQNFSIKDSLSHKNLRKINYIDKNVK